MFLLLLGQAFTQLSRGVLLWHDCIPYNKLVPSSVPLAINQSVSVQVCTFTRMWNPLDKKGLVPLKVGHGATGFPLKPVWCLQLQLQIISLLLPSLRKKIRVAGKPSPLYMVGGTQLRRRQN